MGIVRTSTTRVLAPFDTSLSAVSGAMRAVGMDVAANGNPVVGAAKRSIKRNRWATEVSAGVRPETDATSLIDWTVDMAGDKHQSVLAEIIEAMKVDIDDLGVAEALARLGKMGRFFGAREATALSQFVLVDERVVELAQGVYDGGQGMLVLTTQRLFFFDKSSLGSKVEEFEFSAINSLGHAQKLGGEVINISISGRDAEIKQVAHGRAGTFIQAFRKVRAEHTRPATPAPPIAPGPDPLEQIGKLAELRDAGVLTEDEFAAKKAELLARM